MNKNWKSFIIVVVVFAACWFLPAGAPRFDNAVGESLALVKDYARQHVLLCLVPAFFIAGAISVFVSQSAVMKYLGASANKVVAYGVASVSGGILAVCSCTVLPLFAGIYRMGAGLGPAVAFLYSGPAINVLAIVLTARVLGPELGIARAVGAVVFSVVIGLTMHFLFRKEESRKAASQMAMPENPQPTRRLWQNGLYFASMVGMLVFANWARPEESSTGLWATIHSAKWFITASFTVALAIMLIAWFKRAELKEWTSESWRLALQVLPLLLGGVLMAGLLLGRVENEGLIPSQWIESSVGGNSLRANFFASIAGALMYFATLTEVPILSGLMNSGMGKGPALALLLAGPALSLPSILVIRSVMGTKKTLVYVVLVVVMATISGQVFGVLY